MPRTHLFTSAFVVGHHSQVMRWHWFPIRGREINVESIYSHGFWVDHVRAIRLFMHGHHGQMGVHIITRAHGPSQSQEMTRPHPLPIFLIATAPDLRACLCVYSWWIYKYKYIYVDILLQNCYLCLFSIAHNSFISSFFFGFVFAKHLFSK